MATYDLQTDDFVQAMGLLAKAFRDDPQTSSLGYVRVVSHEGVVVTIRRPPPSWKPKKRLPPKPPPSTVWDRLGNDPEPPSAEIDEVTSSEFKPRKTSKR